MKYALILIFFVCFLALGCKKERDGSNTPSGTDTSAVDFSYNGQLRINKLVHFVALTSDTSVLWDFGDGNTSTVLAPDHKFAQKGIYSVKLTAHNITATKNIVIDLALTGQQIAGLTKSRTYSVYRHDITWGTAYIDTTYFLPDETHALTMTNDTTVDLFGTGSSLRLIEANGIMEFVPPVDTSKYILFAISFPPYSGQYIMYYHHADSVVAGSWTQGGPYRDSVIYRSKN